MTIHPAANIFPRMSAVEFEALKADIDVNGLVEPIWVYQDQILDGRHRYEACRQLGVVPQQQQYEGDNPTGFVLALNLRRRHLSSSQLAFIALELEKYEAVKAKERQLAAQNNDAGRAVKALIPEQDEGQARDKAAIAVGVNPRYVSDAKAIQAAHPSLAEQVRQGDKTITQAMRQLKDEQIRREITAPDAKYRVIYADPPWSYGNTMPDGTTSPRDYYPTTPLSDLCAIPVKDWCEPNAVMFLWVTAPMVMDSLELIHAWGFVYKTHFVWDKVKHNMGHYNSVRHEVVLICTRGSCLPDVPKLFDSVITQERGAHSEKPAVLYEIIETLYPYGKRIELFARARREGWDAWGYEAPASADTGADISEWPADLRVREYPPIDIEGRDGGR